MRLSESLNYHMKEGEVLKKIKERLEEENEKLRGDKELNEMMVQEKVVQAKNQKQQIGVVSTAQPHYTTTFWVHRKKTVHVL